MTRRPCTFKETELKRALRAAKAAGVPVKIVIEDGRLTVTMDERTGSSSSSKNEWDEVLSDNDNGKD